MNIIINNIELGDIEDAIVEKISKRNEGQDISEIVIDYMRRLVDDSDDMNIDELIRYARFRKNNYGYETIADMICSHIKADLRPANEICKNCDKYYDHLCLDMLMEVDPFSKGNSCWRERKEKIDVTNIVEGYMKYGKEDGYHEVSAEDLQTIKTPKEKVVQFRRPRWIEKERVPVKMLSVDDVRKLLDETIHRDQDVLKEKHSETTEDDSINLILIKEELDIIHNNIERYIEISGYLYSIWITARTYGFLSIRNFTEETADTDDELIAYINERAEEVVDGDLIESIPPDPLDNTLDSILTAYSNYVLMSLVAGVNPRRMKDIVKCFVDTSVYRRVMDKISDYTKRYFWLKDKK